MKNFSSGLLRIIKKNDKKHLQKNLLSVIMNIQGHALMSYKISYGGLKL